MKKKYKTKCTKCDCRANRSSNYCVFLCYWALRLQCGRVATSIASIRAGISCVLRINVYCSSLQQFTSATHSPSPNPNTRKEKTPHPNATHSSRQPSAGVVCMHSLSFRYQLHFANNCSNLIYRNQFDWLVPMNTQHGAMRIYNDRQSQSIRISKGAAQNQNQAAHNWRALKQVVRSVVKRHCQFICPFCGSPKRFYIAHTHHTQSCPRDVWLRCQRKQKNYVENNDDGSKLAVTTNHFGVVVTRFLPCPSPSGPRVNCSDAVSVW